MTSDQIKICKGLGKVKCLPGTFDKRMCNSLSSLSPEYELSEKQNEWMYRLLYKFRKQLPNTYNEFKHNEFCNPIKNKLINQNK